MIAIVLCAAGCAGESSIDPPRPAAPVPVLAWSFEPASADCNGWPVSGADAIRASPSRSGAYSCKLCSNGSAAELSLARDVGRVEAGRYTLELWIRRRVQNAAPVEAHARLDADGPDGRASALAPSVAVRDGWDRLEAELDLAEPASNLRITVGAPTPGAERCLFVDDVVLTRE
jgi:hypothetical protein